MRILIDTNILISAALNSHGTPYKAYLKAVTYPNKGIIKYGNIFLNFFTLSPPEINTVINYNKYDFLYDFKGYPLSSTRIT